MIENILFFLEIHISKVPAKLLLKSVYFFLRIPIVTYVLLSNGLQITSQSPLY